MIGVGSIELQTYVTQSKDFIGVLPHLARQIAKTVTLRINGPNDVAHRRHRLARNLRNRREWISRLLVAIGKLLLDNLAENADPREIRANVIVQIRGDARAHVRDLQQAADAIAVEHKSRAAYGEHNERDEPPTQP